MYLHLQHIQPLDETDYLQDCTEAESWEKPPYLADDEDEDIEFEYNSEFANEERWQKRPVFLRPELIMLISPHPLEPKWINLELSTGTFLVVDAELDDLITKLVYIAEKTAISPLTLTKVNPN